MTFNEWLSAERGRLAAIAAHFGLTQSAISQWRTNGVPPGRMLSVRDFTGGAVSLEAMLSANTAHLRPEVIGKSESLAQEVRHAA